MLDERLTLAASLYAPCSLGADIGTDHALLPAFLLAQGICQHMILADISPKALSHAKATVQKQHLEDRTTLVCASGLDALQQPCGCISITGMGGNTLSQILLNGKETLQGAALVLSAHTEQPAVRKTIQEIGYHLTQERLCYCAGRWYILWRADPGFAELTETELRYGTEMLYAVSKETISAYLTHRIQVLRSQCAGMLSAAAPNAFEAERLQEDISYYQSRLEKAT